MHITIIAPFKIFIPDCSFVDTVNVTYGESKLCVNMFFNSISKKPFDTQKKLDISRTYMILPIPISNESE